MPLLRALLRYGSQFLFVLAPLITAHWSLVNWFGHTAAGPHDNITFGILGITLLDGEKEQVELHLRVYLTAAALMMIMAYDFITDYLPSQGLREFRREYLEAQAVQWRKKLGGDVRINVMYAKRRWYTLFLVRHFKWQWSLGFEPPNAHHDANLALMEFQGVCGQALRSAKPCSAYFLDGDAPGVTREGCDALARQFRLLPWQARSTGNIRGILSVPLFRKKGGSSPSYKVVGVINLDSATLEGAGRLRAHERELADYFVRIGKILASVGDE